MWMTKNEALRGLSASSLHPGTFSSPRPSTSHWEAGLGHFPGVPDQSDKWKHTENSGGACNACLGMGDLGRIVDT